MRVERTVKKRGSGARHADRKKRALAHWRRGLARVLPGTLAVDRHVNGGGHAVACTAQKKFIKLLLPCSGPYLVSLQSRARGPLRTSPPGAAVIGRIFFVRLA